MKLNTSVFMCHECKRVHQDLAAMLFVEDAGHRPFCSEACIEEFYAPLSRAFKSQIENHLGEKAYEIKLEDCDEQFWEMIEEDFDERYEWPSEAGPNIVVTIKIGQIKNEAIVVLSTLLKDKMAYIFAVFKVDLLHSLHFFRNSSDENVLEISKDDLEMVEFKKSKLLGELIIHRKDEDFPIETFGEFSQYFSETLQNADEIYEWKDEDGDWRHHYLKNFFSNNGDIFYCLVICFKLIDDEGRNIIIPILSIPTKYNNELMSFKKGKLIFSQTIN